MAKEEETEGAKLERLESEVADLRKELQENLSTKEGFPREVEAAYCEGWNMTPLSVLGITPKFTITCGRCRATFAKRIPKVDRPRIPCPACGTINRLPLVWT